MAKRQTFGLTIGTEQVLALAERLGEVTPEKLAERLVAVTNEQLESAYELSRKRMLSGINLTDAYLRERFEINQATTKRPSGEIVAKARDRGDLTLLSRYDLQVGLLDVKNPEKSKGYGALGIPKGKKQGAPSVEVVRGARKSLKSDRAFVFNSKAGTPLIVKRNPNGKLSSALLGPSVYQLFRVAATDLEQQIGDDYEAAITEAAERELNKVLEA